MTKIKICGLQRAADVEFINAAEPDFAGFVFAPGSRRRVTAAEARALRAGLHSGIVPVGVFVGAEVSDICALGEVGVIAMIQLHGGESLSFIYQLKKASPLPIIQALSVSGDPAALDALREADDGPADYLLLDHGRGGSGQSFDWSLLPPLGKPWFLAGGIHAGNLEAALQLAPFAIDVSSGAETGGVKDEAKILELVQKTKKKAGACL
jgi:phosphoribosylanthranilate isomerase